MMAKYTMTLATIAAALLSACGGGGGSSSSAPQKAAPVVSISASTAKAHVGESFTLSWSATNADSCVASNDWSGSQTAVNTATLTATTGGVKKYTIMCTGDGGSVTATATVVVPLPVKATSTENTKFIDLAPQDVPDVAPDWQQIDSSSGQKINGYIGRTYAFADFFQEGEYSMVAASLGATAPNAATKDTKGHFYFYKKINGKWVDSTSKLLAENSGCVGVGKAFVADINGDKKPDVIFSCGGMDVPPHSGEAVQHALVSQSDGSYKNITLPLYNCYCHGGGAIDFKGDGFADIIFTDSNNQPVFLTNNRDGTFTVDYSRLPSLKYTYGSSEHSYHLWNVEFIDNGSGKYDIFMPGTDYVESINSGADIGSLIIKNDGNNNYSSAIIKKLPGDTTYYVTIDGFYYGGYFYVSSFTGDYSGHVIRKIDPVNNTSTVIATLPELINNGVTHFINYYNGKIVVMDSKTNVSVGL